MKAVILQPSYIPWRGYFDQIRRADIFIFLDDVQYDTRGWRNRNQIKTPKNKQWLTIPVHSHGVQTKNIPINQIKICWDLPWNQNHWKLLQQVYNKAPFFHQYAPLLENFYRRQDEYLADFTIDLTIEIAHLIGIKQTHFIRASSLKIEGSKTDRLISILKSVGANQYLSGPSARDYIVPESFINADISLEYIEYNYPEYPQLYPPYDPNISILDLLFMTGQDALHYIKGDL